MEIAILFLNKMIAAYSVYVVLRVYEVGIIKRKMAVWLEFIAKKTASYLTS